MISTYSELQTAIAAWAHRSDLGGVIPDFIALAEERMNRELRVRQMEVALAETAIASNAIAVPADTVGVKTLWVVGYEGSPLYSRTYEQIIASGTEGTPSGWAWRGSNFYFDGSGAVKGVLYTKIPALSDANTSNWLLASYPSAYLYGALVETAIYVRNTEEVALWEGKFKQALGEIAGNSLRDTLSGPLQARAR